LIKTLLLAATMMSLSMPADAAAAPRSVPLADAIRADMPQLMALYRDLHANPELSMQEVRTPAKLAPEMRRLGFDVTEHVGKTGVVAVLKNGPGPVLLIRADMDALPVTEQTGLPFASKVRAKTAAGVETGVMHACGHDTHITTWLGTARRLAAMKDRWSGTVVMILQPGEETGAGAKAMLDEGLFARFPKPDVMIAFHDSASLPAGQIGVTRGYALANVDSVDLDIHGVGGHGAYPQATKDPIVLGSKIVVSLQTLVSRETDPNDPAVVTVGSFHAGTKHNIIPDEAKLQLTVRSYTPEVRKHLLDGIARIAKGEAIAAGMPDDRMPSMVVEDNFTPATFNTQQLSDHLLSLFSAHFGKDRVVETKPIMGGEDFSRYWLADQTKQSTIFWVGGVPQAKWDLAKGDTSKLPSLHSPFWAPDADAVISTATEAMTVAALDVLKKS
jgi:hippurate hydrolase